MQSFVRLRAPYTPALVGVGYARVSTEGCPCIDNAEVSEALRMPHAAKMHLAGEGHVWPVSDWTFHLDEEEAPGKIFDALRAVARTLPAAERARVEAEVASLITEHGPVRDGLARGLVPDRAVAAAHGAREDRLVRRYKRQLLDYARRTRSRVGFTQTGVDEDDLAKAKASLESSKADAEAQLESLKRISAEVKASLGPDGKPSGGGSLDTAIERANTRDEEGHKAARASLIHYGTEGTKYLAVFPPAAIAWAAATAAALGMMEALNAIGLDKLRVGRGADATTQEWVDRAHADQERLRLAGLPYSIYNEGQHVSPREYAADYLEAQTIAQIDALSPSDRGYLDAMGSAIVRQREIDPVVTYLYAKALIPPMGFVYYAHATTEAPMLTYSSMGVEPDVMIDLIATTAMREAKASAVYYADIRKEAEGGWNMGIALATAGSGPMRYGRGARAAAQAWRWASEEAAKHADTYHASTWIALPYGGTRYAIGLPDDASHGDGGGGGALGDGGGGGALGSSVLSGPVAPIALGALATGGLYLAGVATGVAVIPVILAVLYAAVK